MSDPMERQKQDFDGWLEKWDSALQKGIFGDSPKPPSTFRSTSDESFFGLRQDNPTDSIDSGDSEYWRAINSVADGGVDFQRLDEADAVSLNLPNPIRKSTEGKDQDVSPESVNATFGEEDILELEEMKKKLHEFESKAAAMDGKDHRSQIESMIKKIDELSDKLGRTDK